MLVDSHCHLDLLNLDETQILSDSQEEDVGYLQTICTKISKFPALHKLALTHPNLFCSVGIHPNEVEKEGLFSSDQISDLAKLDKVIGIGETGLDYYRDDSSKEMQKQNFLNHIQVSQELQMPLIIHTRSAKEDTLAMIRESQKMKAYPALIHCFTEDSDFAIQMLDLGLYISISGIVTFKNAEALRESVKLIPLDRLLIETDAPYLAPMPYRGQINHPKYLKHTAEFLANFLGIAFEDLSNQTTENFFRLFTKASMLN